MRDLLPSEWRRVILPRLSMRSRLPDELTPAAMVSLCLGRGYCRSPRHTGGSRGAIVLLP